jgi:hypothetical protein
MLTIILTSLVLTVTVKMVLDCIGGEVEDEGRITRRRSIR